MAKIRIKTAHGTYLRAGDKGEVNQAKEAKSWEEFEIEDVPPLIQPAPPTPPPDEGGLPPLIKGNWRGNFLYPYFGSACAAYTDTRRKQYFATLRNRGDTHVGINAQQVDWGGETLWTGGSNGPFADEIGARYSVNANKSERAMLHLIAVCLEARRAGLTPWVGLIEQQTLKMWDFDACVEASVETAEAIRAHTTLLMLGWELDEVWGNGGTREPKIRQWIERLNRVVDPSKVDIGIHLADGLRGGNIFYGSLPDNTVRLMQYWNSSDEGQLREASRLVAEVAATTGTRVCAFEHSSPENQGPNRTEAQANQRAHVCLTEMRKLLPWHRTGSLNGWLSWPQW